MQSQLSMPDAAFNFTESDLKENRKGKLSERQVALIRNDAIRTAGIICGCVLAVTLLGLFSARNTLGSDVQFVGILIVGVLILAFWFYVLRAENAIRDRQVEAITGEANVLPTYNGGTLVINERIFRLTTTELRGLRGGEPYTIYMLPKLKKIVSIENYQDPDSGKSEPAMITLPGMDGGRELLRG